MPIKEPILFITVDDFKSWKGFDKLLFENVTNSDENIWFAISVACSNIDYFSGFAISKKWPEQTLTAFTDNVQTATAHYVRFLCTKGVDYTRGQASMAQGGIVYSESNPEDPYYIPLEVFNCLRNIKEYTAFQGFNLNVKPKTSFFSQFLSNKGEINPLENYLQITNTIAGFGLKITPTHPVNIMGTILTFSIDSNVIIPKSETLFNNSFSNDAFQLVDGKIGQQPKVISLSDQVGELIESKQDKLTVNENHFNLNKFNINKELELLAGFNSPLIQQILLINEYSQLETVNKTPFGAINELKSPWKDVGKTSGNRQLNYNFINGKQYRAKINWGTPNDIANIWIYFEFIINETAKLGQWIYLDINNVITGSLTLQVKNDGLTLIATGTIGSDSGWIDKLEESIY